MYINLELEWALELSRIEREAYQRAEAKIKSQQLGEAFEANSAESIRALPLRVGPSISVAV